MFLSWFLVLSLGWAAVHVDGVYYTQLESASSYCDQSLTIPCPGSTGESGTIRYWYLPYETKCNTTFSLASSCGSTYDTYAIYFNIKKSVMPSSHNITIYENGRLVKTIPGGTLSQSFRPTSVAQLLSTYSRRPSLSLVYTKGAGTYPSPDVIFDYTVVYKESYYAYNSRCEALNGYVHDNYICDGSVADRVNCPSSYSASTGTSYNYASYRQSCLRETGVTTTSSWYRPSYDNSYYYDDGLSGGAIAGIIMAVIIGVTFFVTLISIACKRSNMNTRTTRVQHAMVTNRNTAPIVAGGYHPQQAAGTTVHFQTNVGSTSYQPPVFAGAPPSYAAVTASSAPYPMQGLGPASYPAGQASFSVGESGALPYPAAQGGPMPYLAGETPKF